MIPLHDVQGGLQRAGGGEVAGLLSAGLGDQPAQPAYVFSVHVPFSGGSYAAVCSVHGQFMSGLCQMGPRLAERQQCPWCAVKGGR